MPFRRFGRLGTSRLFQWSRVRVGVSGRGRIRGRGRRLIEPELHHLSVVFALTVLLECIRFRLRPTRPMKSVFSSGSIYPRTADAQVIPHLWLKGLLEPFDVSICLGHYTA